jgi:hypothetical protein
MVMAVTLSIAAASPAWAAAERGTPSPFAPAALAKAVSASDAPAAPKASAAPAPQASTDSIWKGKARLVVLAVFVAGAGYAIYSSKEDRIRGLNR